MEISVLSVFLVCFSACSRADSCSGPAALEAKLRSVPTAAVYNELGHWFDLQNESSCAVESYRAALKVDATSRVAIDGLSKALIATSDPVAAISLLKTASPTEELILDLGAAYSRAGMLPEAFQTLTRGLRSYPSSARLTSALVVVLANHGQLDDAYRLAEKFAQQHPHDSEAQKVLLRVLVATNDAGAASQARRLLAASPHDSELLYLNGVLERKAGAYVLARKHLEEAIVLTPNYPESHYNLGIVLARLQQPVEAGRELQKAIELGTSEPEAHLELSNTFKSLGQSSQADEQLQLYQQAMKGNADRAIASSKVADADAALGNGDAGKAASLYREAIEVSPQDASLLYKLSIALDRTGDLQGERTALEQSIHLDSSRPPTHHQLGYLLYRSGDYDSAIEQFRAAVHDDPGFTAGWISLAATLAAQSHFGEAQEAIHHALHIEPGNKEALALKKQLDAAQAVH